MVLADFRLDINNGLNNSLQSIPFESDHNAISFKVSLNRLEIELNTSDLSSALNFNKTNWKNFQNSFKDNCKLNILIDKNLNNTEIDETITVVKNLILNAMEQHIPKHKTQNSTDKYINPKIRKLQKDKNFILSQIHRHKRKNLQDNELILLNTILYNIREAIKYEINRSMNEYWENRKDYSHRLVTHVL